MVSDKSILVVYAMGLMKCCPFVARLVTCPFGGTLHRLNPRDSYNYLIALPVNELNLLIDSHARCYKSRVLQGFHVILN
jgi:hypothetical protein